MCLLLGGWHPERLPVLRKEEIWGPNFKLFWIKCGERSQWEVAIGLLVSLRIILIYAFMLLVPRYRCFYVFMEVANQVGVRPGSVIAIRMGSFFSSPSHFMRKILPWRDMRMACGSQGIRIK